MRKRTITRIFSLLLVMAITLSFLPISQAATFDTQNFKGLVIRAESGVSIKLYSGFSYSSKNTVLTPDYKETVGADTLYYYAGYTGKYVCRASKTGCYIFYQQIYMSDAMANTKTEVTIEMVEMEGSGWEDTSIYLRTPAVEAAFDNKSEAWWKNYGGKLVSPAFTETDRGLHQMTTQPELEAFLANLDDADDNMYIFSLGTSSTYNLDIPVVVFTQTDLSGAKDLKDAAAMMQKQGKPIMEYRAQMHGNEPAAGEAAMNVIADMDGSYGETVLDDLNIYIIPRLNPDGGYANTRAVGTGQDPNRDMLSLETLEMQMHQQLYWLMNPVLIIDGHERNNNNTKADLTVGIGSTLKNSQEFTNTTLAITEEIFAALEAQDMSGYWYSDDVNSADINISRAYSASQGTLFILMESIGIELGLAAYEARTISQFIGAETIISYVADHAEEIATLVAAEKARFVETGATYEASDIVVLSTGKHKNTNFEMLVDVYDLATGAVKETSLTPYVYDTASRYRTAPTAYVIPADLESINDILWLMDLQGVAYSYLPANATLNLQQYYGTMEEAFLTGERAVTFGGGAYVFTMNQTSRNILSVLMEPDCTDANGAEYNGGLVKQGKLVADGAGFFPIYRYITDLNAEGTVDYVIAPAAPEGLSVQAGVITGLDANKTYEYRAATDETYTKVAKGATTISNLSAGIWYVRYAATENTLASAEVKLEVGGFVTVYVSAASGKDSNNGYSQSAPVATLEKAYSQLSAAIGAAADSSEGMIVLLDDYTIESNVAAEMPAHTYPVTIRGNKASVKLICKLTGGTSAKNCVYFNGPTALDNLNVVSGITAKYGYICASGNKMTVTATVTSTADSRGYYINLMGGRYSTGVDSADLTVLGGTWRNVYAGGYKATNTGTVKLVMKNCTVTNLIQNAYQGTSTGDVFISLTNVKASDVYCGNANSGNVGGNVELTLGEGVSVSGAVYTGSRDAGDMLGTVTVIADGCDLTAITLKNSGAGTIANAEFVYASGIALPVTGFDSTRIQTKTNLTLGADVSVDSVSGGGSVELNGFDLQVKGERYSAAVKKVNLRANAAGIYFTGDFAYGKDMTAYGMALSVTDENPCAKDGTTSLYTAGHNSVLVKDILSAGAADTAVYARAYIKFSDGTCVYSDTVQATFHQVVQAADSMWDSLTASQRQTLLDLYNANTAIMANWKLPNIQKNA